MLDFLRHEGIDAQIIKRIEDFRNTYPVSAEMAGRVPAPKYHYYGKDVWEKALTALISGEYCLVDSLGKLFLTKNKAATGTS